MATLRPDDPPPPKYAFGYRSQPPSGNEINGLGEEANRQARPVFHDAGHGQIAWQALDNFFSMINPWPVVRHVLTNAWQLRHRNPPVSPRRIEVSDPAAMAEEIKKKVRELGAELVGVTEISEEALFEGRSVREKYAICIGLSMDQEEMQHVPQPRAAAEVMRVYRAVSRIALRLAKHIAGLGWPAKAYGNPNSTDILHIPLAINAGLGQLGKHGSMISLEHGSNFRLAAVLTDLPMATDQPVDIGVDDICLQCRRCVVDCPPDAIFDTKQMVRGERKWYVDFDKCIPYFVKTYGCAICIEVCPWSKPGRGPTLSQTMLAKRASRAS